MPVRNAADPSQVKSAERKESYSRNLLDRSYEEIIESAAGRRVLWDLLEYCKLYELSFTGNSETYFNEGRRSVGLKIFGTIARVAPGAFVEMMKEAKKREESNA